MRSVSFCPRGSCYSTVLQDGASVGQGTTAEPSFGARRAWAGLGLRRIAYGKERQQRAHRGCEKPDSLRASPRCHRGVDGVLGAFDDASPSPGMLAVT